MKLNNELTQPYTHKEVEEALHQMNSYKTIGPDGMSPIFYQQFWHIIGPSISIPILHSRNAGSIPSSINHTHT